MQMGVGTQTGMGDRVRERETDGGGAGIYFWNMSIAWLVMPVKSFRSQVA